MSMGKNKGRSSNGVFTRFPDKSLKGPEIEKDKKDGMGPLKVLKKGDRKIGILKNGNGYYLRDFEKDESPGCHTIEYPSLKLAERDARYFLKKGEEVVTGKDAGLCSSCDRTGYFMMVNCEGWKTNQVIKAIKRSGGG